MKSCPHCNGTGGYRSSAQVTGTVYYEHFWESPEPEDIDNSQMYDNLNYKPAKNVVCVDCGKRCDLDDASKAGR